MAGGYEQLKESWRVTENNEQVTGTKKYIEIDGGSSDIPELGDIFSTEYPTAVAVEITIELNGYYDKDACKNRHVYTVDYETPSESGSYTPIQSSDSEQRSFTAGGEILSINGGKNDAGQWYWTPTATEAQIGSASGKVIQKIYKANTVGTFGRTVRVATSGFTDYINGNVFPNLGRINSVAFESGGYGLFNKGTCLFNSVSGSLAKNNSGTNEWLLNLSFSYKIIPDLDTQEDTWQYLWRADTSGDFSEGAFQVPIKKISDFPLYEGMMYKYADLNDVYDGILT